MALCKRHASDKLIELRDQIWDKLTAKNNCGWDKIFYRMNIILLAYTGEVHMGRYKHARLVLIWPTEENSEHERNLN